MQKAASARRYNVGMARLTREEIDAFLEERHTLVIATLRRDGTSHLSTVWYRWDGNAFWISTNRDRLKYRNLARDPRVTVLVDAPPRETSVTASGQAEVAALDDDAYEGALAIVSRYVDDGVAYLDVRKGEPRALIRIRPGRIVSWRPD
jgi:PPOX class probable F420-dependent enzyme